MKEKSRLSQWAECIRDRIVEWLKLLLMIKSESTNILPTPSVLLRASLQLGESWSKHSFA